MAANPSNSAGVCTTPAVRTSVAGTQYFNTGTAYTSSAVTSTTQDLRLAYPSTECNIPVIA